MTIQEIVGMWAKNALPADLETLRYMEAEILAAGLKVLQAIAASTELPTAEKLIEEHNLLADIHACLEIAINNLLPLA